jgi:hypothetical protein
MAPSKASRKGLEHGDKAGREQGVEAWLQGWARLMPDLLPRSAPWVRGVFDHAWAPMRALADQVRLLPNGLWDFLSSCPDGFVVISPNSSRYEPGLATVGRRQLRNVAFVSVEDLAEDNEQTLHIIGHLVDHYLGCAGEEQGMWLTDGGGLVPRWQEAGQRLHELFVLGYGVDEVAQANVRDYFARSLAWYCRERQALNVADPQIEKWLRSTLWDAGFWRARP